MPHLPGTVAITLCRLLSWNFLSATPTVTVNSVADVSIVDGGRP